VCLRVVYLFTAGLDFDARLSHPFVRPDGGFSSATRSDGDVLARWSVRVEEVRTSLALLADFVERAGPLDAVAPLGAVAAEGHAPPTSPGGGVGSNVHYSVGDPMLFELL